MMTIYKFEFENNYLMWNQYARYRVMVMPVSVIDDKTAVYQAVISTQLNTGEWYKDIDLDHLIVRAPITKERIFATILAELQAAEPLVYNFTDYLDEHCPGAVEAFEDGSYFECLEDDE